MAQVYIPVALRRKILLAAGHRCGYCLTNREFTAMPLHVEHLTPIAAGGETVEDNLWLSCPYCNGHKAAKTDVQDPDTGTVVTLYNPRFQNWFEHFRWSDDGQLIIGQTAIGRATVEALHLNNSYLVRARRRWVLAGWHPPTA